MSFCSEVKNELLQLRLSGCCKPAFVYGFMLFGRSFSFKKISLQTANHEVAKAYSDAVFSVYKIRPQIFCGGSKIPTYRAEVVSEAERLKILASFDFGVGESLIDTGVFLRECCVHSFIRGAFLACGNINDPEKEYRAEFNVKNPDLAEAFSELLKQNGITMRTALRKNGAQLYTKESSVIEDLLTLIGAAKQTLSIIDTKIMKEVKNNINRVGNCDNANISKTVEASIKQRTAIEFLEAADRLYSLPQELLSAALLRKNNPNATLKELCRLSDEPLTISGLNHRLAKIISIYEQMLENNS
ncbi:MAG: DNA-binding protein WhiA [Clostridia bacterium]|nr:DNA-binding protein WhiA [Clostridia bacterium]